MQRKKRKENGNEMEDVIQSSIFATILTLCVTFATCIIGEVQGYRKMKLEHFDTIYHCLEDFTKKRAKILDKCSQKSEELSEILPDLNDKYSKKDFIARYHLIYRGMNQIITEYSNCLEFYLAVSHFLYKYKSLRPIMKAECWNILKIYEKVVEAGKEDYYHIQYSQIVNLVEVIRITGNFRDKKALKKYLKDNQVNKF